MLVAERCVVRKFDWSRHAEICEVLDRAGFSVALADEHGGSDGAIIETDIVDEDQVPDRIDLVHMIWEAHGSCCKVLFRITEDERDEVYETDADLNQAVPLEGEG